MVARTLQARLTLRLLALAATVLVGVGVAAVAVTDRILEASETEAARNLAAAARDAVQRELGEGDAPEKALAEVVEAARAQGIRLAVRATAGAAREPDGSALPDLPRGKCADVRDDRGHPWRACASDDPQASVVAAVPVASHRAAVGALAKGMVLVVAMALGLFWLAVRGALKAPIAELTALVDWTKGIADRERPLAPPPSATREIAELEGAFDSLVRRLLEALARERTSSAHIAHELRTPLTAITTELETIAATDAGSRAAIERARGDLARLADVIEAILVLSDGSPRPVGTGAIVNIADLARELVPFGAEIDAPDEALVEGDERLVLLAARNLVENAKKYGGSVTAVRVSRDAAGVRLSVVDAGPGLDEGARARMFDRYWRGSADGDGRGLGLALVRAVAERHGGRAEARPGPDGRGLDVGMTLGRVIGWND